MTKTKLIGELVAVHTEAHSLLDVKGEVGESVKLNMEAIERCGDREAIFWAKRFRDLFGVIRRTWRPSGWPLMCVVDFGERGTWDGPATMLRSGYSDA